ncbi:MAG: HAD family hydrolase [Treponema sp.]|jgi:phosphoglycolate phosphatase|nr:HAD family hydrolase [Treponema sp.]
MQDLKDMKFKAVLFDCDGTLVDTLGDISVSMNRALKNNGFPEVPLEAYRDKVGWGIKRLAFLCMPEEARNDDLAAKIAAEASGYYAEAPLVHTKPYPGISELVAELRRRKIKTAVLTNKPDPLAQLVINGLFPQGYFDIIQGEIKGKPRKPDPACAWDIIVSLGLTPRDTIFAGDSEIDLETARNAECHALGVSWGYRPREVLEKAGAQRIIDTPVQILELL